MAQIAASIDYEIAPPPAGLPDDMKALAGRVAAVPVDQGNRRVQGSGRAVAT
jgi:hypothetical protein